MHCVFSWILDITFFSSLGGPLVLSCMKCLLVTLHFIQRIQCQLAERYLWYPQDTNACYTYSIFRFVQCKLHKSCQTVTLTWEQVTRCATVVWLSCDHNYIVAGSWWLYAYLIIVAIIYIKKDPTSHWLAHWYRWKVHLKWWYGCKLYGCKFPNFLIYCSKAKYYYDLWACIST